MSVGSKIVILSMFVAGCVHLPGPGRARVGAQGGEAVELSQANPATAAQSPQQTVPAPVADHHVHLLSPQGADLLTPPLLPEIRLPDDLAEVLQARNQLRTDQAGLETLYTDDALYFIGGTVGFARGAKAVAGHVKWTISDFPYRIVPVSYSRRGSSAQVAGYFMEGENFDSRFGFSQLSLAQGSDGKWRIASETYIFQEPPPPFQKPVTARDKIAELDAAGTRVAAVLSNAYYYDSVRPEVVPDAYSKLRRENDWTAEQVAQFPDRLFGFCSFNALKDYALAELERCAANGKFTGVKLHFNAAQVNLRDPQQVAKVREVMRAINRHRMPMIIHVRTGNPYGGEDAEVFLHQLVAAAPDVPIQVAHLWGGEDYSPDALKVFADAVSSGDPVTRNLYFDISGLGYYSRPSKMPEIVSRIRQIGISRILWGSDAPAGESWQLFRKNVPLTHDEMRSIATNTAPFLRRKKD